MTNKTILKWAGSKVRIMEQLRPHLPKAKRLVEPFAGSCAVMMNTDYEQYLIADVNDDLINLYLMIQDDTEYFLKKELEWPSLNTESNYKAQRTLFNTLNKDGYNHPFRFLYLNRHCFNGLCRYNSRGEFNVPYGHYKNAYYPINEIIAFSEKARDANIVCLEWQDTLSLVEDGDGIYCDPPYFGDSFTLYHPAGFTNSDHESLAIALKDINDMQGNPITVSNSLEAKELYADLGFIIHEIEAPRTIAANGNRKPAKEIIAVLNGDAQ
ncbi:Dam family site-specific DNA-(adenine-N6)-methyltransferase [Providencia rettgeri]|nr:Dam family site-specific DNA-(adenine-N6)-methyltransferase [Providencia rettgeri]